MIHNWYLMFCFDSITIAFLGKKEKTIHNTCLALYEDNTLACLNAYLFLYAYSA